MFCFASYRGRAQVLLASAGLFLLTPQAHAQRYADVLGNYERGLLTDTVFGSDPAEFFDNPLAALGGPGETVVLDEGTTTSIVSLGTWSDDPTDGDNTSTPGLVLGFSQVVDNVAGDDLKVVGNAPSSFIFYEPGFVEVARESSGGGATATGWQDETFYLLKPDNFDLITDPTTAANPITVTSDPVTFALSYSAPFDDPADLGGYFDVTPGGDTFDISDAIDASGDPVVLSDIAYIRLRSVSDGTFPFSPVSGLAPDVDYVEVIPEPSSAALLALAGTVLLRRRRA